MTFEQYWEKLTERVPQLAGDESIKMTISVGSFKSAIRRSFEEGQGDDEDTLKAARDFGKFGRPGVGDLFSTFGNIFGG